MRCSREQRRGFCLCEGGGAFFLFLSLSLLKRFNGNEIKNRVLGRGDASPRGRGRLKKNFPSFRREFKARRVLSIDEKRSSSSIKYTFETRLSFFLEFRRTEFLTNLNKIKEFGDGEILINKRNFKIF